MGRKWFIILLRAVFVLAAGVFIIGQTVSQRVRPRALPEPTTACQFSGTYRINVDASDRLYSAVRDATSTVPFRDQQQFFMDLSVRLTPPDLLAISCSGDRVTVASSRASKVTFTADGRARQERSSTGTFVNSRISMTRDTVTFTSNGKADDNLNVVFRAIDNGTRLRVIRRIDADQLSQPVVIQSVYDKISDAVDWDIYENRLLADKNDRPATQPSASQRQVATATSNSRGETAADLRRSLDEWIAATNSRNIDRQMSFYMPELSAFYLTRNTPRSVVRAEKNRAFSTARSIDIRAEEPEIIFQDNGRTAVMRFRKQYRIADRDRTRSGEVVQELRWQKTSAGWRIFSERDVRVIR
jgi:ketosteroid isomerase-like protein